MSVIICNSYYIFVFMLLLLFIIILVYYIKIVFFFLFSFFYYERGVPLKLQTRGHQSIETCICAAICIRDRNDAILYLTQRMLVHQYAWRKSDLPNHDNRSMLVFFTNAWRFLCNEDTQFAATIILCKQLYNHIRSKMFRRSISRKFVFRM